VYGDDSITYTTIQLSSSECTQRGGVPQGTGSASRCRIPVTTGDPTKAVQTDPTTPNRTNNLTNTSDDIGCFTNGLHPSVCLSNVVYIFTVGLGSALAYVGAFVFDTTVSLSLNSAAYALSFLSSGWTTARDLANMAFILILVYIAYTIMFQAETANTMRMLVGVIFIALIINFSFFFTRVVIDVGNILAVQFYNSIDAPTLDQTFTNTSGGLAGAAASATQSVGSLVSGGTFANTKDLTSSIMQALDITKLFNNNSFKNAFKESGFLSSVIILSSLYIFIGAAYFILAAMFLAVGVKFLMRIVVLWFLIIASPLAFVAKAVPRKEVSGWYDRWQSELVRHAFYPAFFLFIFFFISTIMKGLSCGTGGVAANCAGSLLGGLASDLNSLATNPGISGLIYIASAMANVSIRLGFVIAMLYIALKASEFMGVRGAAAAHGVTGWVSRAGTGAVFGGAGVFGRYTIGLAGQRIAQNSSLKGASSGSGVGAVGAGLLQLTGAGLSKRSFDLRGVGGVRKGLGMVGIDTNGPSGVGGYAKSYKERVERKVARSEEFKQDKAAYERELRKVVRALPEEEKENIAQLGKAVKDAEDDAKAYGNGDGRGQRVKDAKKQLKDAIKPYEDEAKKKAGDFKDDYAKSIITPGFRNLWGVASSGIPGYISRADQEAYSKIHSDKNDGGKIMAIIGKKPAEAPEGNRWSGRAKAFVPEKVTSGAYEFGIGNKAWMKDGNKVRSVDIVDFSVDGKKAYLKDGKEVDVSELHEEQDQARGPQQQNQPVRTSTIVAGVTDQQGEGQQTLPKTSPIIIPSSDIPTNRLTDAEREARRAPNPPRGGTPGNPGPLPFSPRPMGPTSPISGGSGTPPQTPPTPPSTSSPAPTSGGSNASALTREAEDLISSADRGAPGFVSNNMRRILQENGIPESDIRNKTPSELIEQLKEFRSDLNKLQGVVNQSRPQSFVKPPSQQEPWTPKPAETTFSTEQKRQVKDILKEAIDAQTEKLGEKFAAITEDINHKEDIKTREEWLKKEGKRILDNRGPNDHISTDENPPPPPRQKPEDAKPE
jgi:hypothetical protein